MLLAISHAPVFGWAKPVPVNYARLRNPRRDMVLVALAGPGMNLLLALFGTALLTATIMLSGGAQSGGAAILAANALNFVLINIFLAVFNLLPVPPFDGGHVVEGLLPRPLAVQFRRLGRYSLFLLMILLLVLPALGHGRRRTCRIARSSTGSRACCWGCSDCGREMLHGWIILDKPVGLGSTQAVSAVKRAAARGGRAEDQGRPRRHARPARQRRAADRAWRSDQARRPDARRDQGL